MQAQMCMHCNESRDFPRRLQEAASRIAPYVQAWENLCFTTSPNKDAYQGCVAGYKNQLKAAGLVTASQAGKIASCAAKRVK